MSRTSRTTAAVSVYGGNIAFAPSEPAVIAQAYVKLHDERRDAELHYVAYDG